VIRRLCAWVARLTAGFLIVSVAPVVVYRFVAPPLTPLMLIRTMERLAAGHPVEITRRWVNLDGLGPTLLRAVVAGEDTRFFRHHGVDLDALERARAYNARQRGRRLRGASTITMQCARNVFLWPGRSYVRKGLELYFAILLELLWSKQRIVEVYLNVIEWGDGVYGAEAAARRYFGVPASRLTAEQAALLAAALPDPRHRNPAAPTPFLRARAAGIEARAAAVRLGPVRVSPAAAARVERRAATRSGRGG